MKRKALIALLLSLLMVLSSCTTPVTKLPTVDRAGYEIKLPAKVETIVSMAPSITQILDELGQKDKIVGVDTQTPLYVEGTQALPQFDLMSPDLEAMAALKPDLVLVTGMSSMGGDDAYSPLKELGIAVVTISSSASIEDVKLDTQFVADVLGLSQKGEAINAQMQKDIDAIAAIGKTITEPKTVLFEIAALPNIYSFGHSTFLNELIELIGAKNVFADQESWIAVTEEAAISKNPDVILTNVNYIENSVGEILSREGWGEVTAIKNQAVYYIDNGYSSLPNHNIVKALKEMARAVYPEAYAELKE